MDTYKMHQAWMFPVDTKVTCALMEFRKFSGVLTKVGQVSNDIIFCGVAEFVRRLMHGFDDDDMNMIKEFCDLSRLPDAAELPVVEIGGRKYLADVEFQFLPEACVIAPHVPFGRIIARNKAARFVTYYETLTLHLWYPSTVATFARHARNVVGLQLNSDTGCQEGPFFHLHNFGARGAVNVDAVVAAQLACSLAFDGSDCALPGGKAVSVLATEHSVIAAHQGDHNFTKFLRTHPKAIYDVQKPDATGKRCIIHKFCQVLLTLCRSRRNARSWHNARNLGSLT